MLSVLLLLVEASSLSLTCTGTATVQMTTSSSRVVASDNSGEMATAEGSQTAPVAIALTTRFELENDRARIFLPAEMRPALSSSGDGWYPVSELLVGERNITGKVKLSLIRSTTIEIDRNTGILTTKHGYTANCSAVDRSKRKF